MIQIINKRKCSGCTACYSICPKHCIEMRKDEEGFLYPFVNKDICINCGACEKICPVINRVNISASLSETFAVQNKDRSVLYDSASGGAFTAISMPTVLEGGTVYGAAYTKEWEIQHLGTQKIAELSRFRNSKYVQSKQGDVFSEIKEKILNGEQVCYSGTPCQVAGLKSFLKEDSENLFTVDLVCKGVSSPLLFQKYIKYMKEKYDSDIVGVNFKRKTYGYHSSTMSVDFANGIRYSRGGITDPMMRSFRANICLRPSCADCAFKGINRISDMTLFDCWHYEQLSKLKDNDKGHTAILVHTKKGESRLKACTKWLDIKRINLEQVVKLDGIMIENQVIEHPKRDLFMNYIKDNDLIPAIKKYIPITIIDRLKDSSKGFLYKIHLLNLVKKL